MDSNGSEQTGLTRREFIKGSVASSVALAMGVSPQSQAETSAHPLQLFSEMRALAPGMIRPEGWLRPHLEGQARLASALPEISYPFFHGTFWEGEENSPAWFTWEQKAYWVDGATRLALVLDDQALLTTARASLDFTVNHSSPNGFLGPNFLEFGDDVFGLNRWPNTIFNRALMALADAQPGAENAEREKIIGALAKHYLNDKADYTNASRNITNLEVILWCYERTGDRRFLEIAQTAWDRYVADAEAESVAAEAATRAGQPRPMFSAHSDLAPSRVFANTAVNSHGVSYAEISKLPAILYAYTGEEKYRDFAAAAQRRVLDHHMLIDGIPSSSEAYAGTTALDEHETCDITDHAWAWTYILQATGDGMWGDHIERACFNAHPGATRPDWKGIQYFGSPNQFLANLNCDHGTTRWFGSRRLAYQPNPAQVIGCCGGNKHRFVPNYVLNMWMKTKENGLAATLYGASTVTTNVGSENREVKVIQSTNYPFDEEIRFTVMTEKPVSFPLALRIPAWCDAPQIRVNGTLLQHPPAMKGFVTIRRLYTSGDVVSLTLPMKIKVSKWPNNGIGIERGPLVYALPIDTQWKSLAEDSYSSAEFPTWEANPTGKWNYAVILNPHDPNGGIEVVPRTTNQAVETSPWPWTDATTTLVVSARKIEGWDYEKNSQAPYQRFTPHLPDMHGIKVSQDVERLTLVPFGSTQLRMSIFPRIES